MHVKDTSRAIGVTTKLLSVDMKDDFSKEIQTEYDTVRERHKGKQAKIVAPLH